MGNKYFPKQFPWIYVCPYVVSLCLDYRSFVVNFETGKFKSSKLALFLKTVLAILVCYFKKLCFIP